MRTMISDIDGEKCIVISDLLNEFQKADKEKSDLAHFGALMQNLYYRIKELEQREATKND